MDYQQRFRMIFDKHVSECVKTEPQNPSAETQLTGRVNGSNHLYLRLGFNESNPNNGYLEIGTEYGNVPEFGSHRIELGRYFGSGGGRERCRLFVIVQTGSGSWQMRLGSGPRSLEAARLFHSIYGDVIEIAAAMPEFFEKEEHVSATNP